MGESRKLNIRNFRDISGYKNRYGETMKSGCIFRGASLHGIGEADALWMEEELGIRYILDYRDEKEAALTPDVPFPKASYERIGALGQRFDFGNLIHTAMTAELLSQLTEFLKHGYRQMPFDNPSYHRLFEWLPRGDVHVYFPCTAGKDRTGVSGFLIIMALGMEEEDAVSEYLRSNRFLEAENEALRRQLNIPDELRDASMPLLYVQREFIQCAIDAIKERYESYEAFFQQEYGLDEKARRRLRDLYCE